MELIRAGDLLVRVSGGPYDLINLPALLGRPHKVELQLPSNPLRDLRRIQIQMNFFARLPLPVLQARVEQHIRRRVVRRPVRDARVIRDRRRQGDQQRVAIVADLHDGVNELSLIVVLIEPLMFDEQIPNEFVHLPVVARRLSLLDDPADHRRHG